jgi:hypothetical protein
MFARDFIRTHFFLGSLPQRFRTQKLKSDRPYRVTLLYFFAKDTAEFKKLIFTIFFRDMENKIVLALKDLTSDNTIKVQGLVSRVPIDCIGSSCKRFIRQEYDYTLKKLQNKFVLGIAMPKMFKNGNLTFSTQFNRNPRGKTYVDIDYCDNNS